MMKKITLFVFAIAATFSAVAQNFTATYTFDSVKTTSGLTDPTPVPTATGVTLGSFSIVGTTALNAVGAGRFVFDKWSVGATNGDNTYANLAGAIDINQYFEVTLTPTSGFDVTLTKIAIPVRRSSTGARTYSVRSSADSYAANLPASVVNNTNINVEANNVFFWNNDNSSTTTHSGSTITLSGASFTNTSSPITFRIYVWNAESNSGTFGLDSVIFHGSVTALTTGINAFSNNIVPVIYPNPSTDGLFTVNAGTTVGATSVTVYNIIGKVVYSTELVNGKETIDLSNQANGSYFVAIKNDSGLITRKVVINK